jgi:hypothetical protein
MASEKYLNVVELVSNDDSVVQCPLWVRSRHERDNGERPL